MRGGGPGIPESVREQFSTIQSLIEQLPEGAAIGSAITDGTAGSVLFIDASGNLAQDNANLFWDNTNNRLGIGTNSPRTTLESSGSMLVSGSGDPSSGSGLQMLWTGSSGIVRSFDWDTSTYKGFTFQVNSFAVANASGNIFNIASDGAATIKSATIENANTANSVIFVDASGNLAEDAGFTWDDTNRILELGSADDNILRFHLEKTSIGAESYGKIQWEGDDVSSGGAASGVRAQIDIQGTATGGGNAVMIFSVAPDNSATLRDIMSFDGNNASMGVGTTSPIARCHILAQNGTQFRDFLIDGDYSHPNFQIRVNATPGNHTDSNIFMNVDKNQNGTWHGLLITGFFQDKKPDATLQVVGEAGDTDAAVLFDFETVSTGVVFRANASPQLAAASDTVMQVDGSGTVGINNGSTNPAYTLDVYGPISGQELSADPANPAEGHWVIWQSDGTGTGDDGDILIKITAAGTTKTATLVDFSAV